MEERFGVETRNECSVAECENPVEAWGWCNAHYLRWRAHGDVRADQPVRQKSASPEAAFEKHTERRGECLIWTGLVNEEGYGKIWVRGRYVRAHRYSWEAANGPIPAGMLVDHRYHCSTACVEPTHLRLADGWENQANRSGAAKNNRGTRHRNVVRKTSGKYQVQVQKNGKQHYFGLHDTLEQAIVQAESARAELFGEFAGGA